MQNQPFLRGIDRQKDLPLEAYLPTFPDSIITNWLRQNPPDGGMVLMPFGSSPQLAVEAAQAGYRVLIPVNNPITHFLLQWLCKPATTEQLRSVLVKLSSTYKGSDRLEPYILSLYETECPHCEKPIAAQAFLWSKSPAAPVQKWCYCDQCQDSGEYSVNENDIQKALTYQENSLYHARALTRVAPPQDPVRVHAEKALQVYSPRTVYALFTIINKISSLDLTPSERFWLDGLLLHAFESCSSLNDPSAAEALKPSRLPQQFWERNVWHSLEEAVSSWDLAGPEVPLTAWPETPPRQGGVAAFAGRFKDLIPVLSGTEIGAGILVVPRPNPTYWSLSALWTGWLWGQEAAAPLRNILSLRDFHWTWYTRGVESILNEFTPLHTKPSPCFVLLADADEDFLTAVLMAGNSAGFSSTSIAVDPDHQMVQMEWTQGQEKNQKMDLNPRAVLRDAGYLLLQNRGEPAAGLLLKAAGLTALGRENSFPDHSTSDDANFDTVKTLLDETYAYRQGFLYYPELDYWWHQELAPDPAPLVDRVEQEVVQVMLDQETPLQLTTLENIINQSNPGLLTPGAETIRVCLDSYAEKMTSQPNLWRIKPGEQPSHRRDDLREITDLLEKMGVDLGFRVKEKTPLNGVQVLTWAESTGEQVAFYISASALLNKILLSEPRSPQRWIVIPASRAELILHKLRQNPPLAEYFDQGWNFLKYRHVRRLAEESSLTRENLTERLALDPLTSDEPQLPLI